MAGSGYGADPSKIRELAQYLNQIIFCLYAEDAGLLPDGAFTGLVVNQRREPDRFRQGAQTLFAEMNHGGLFGPQTIEHFNGELFAHVPDVTLNTVALERLAEAATKNWSNIEPSIFGTLFERALGLTEERAPLGAHYTSEADIRRVVQPVILGPSATAMAARQSGSRCRPVHRRHRRRNGRDAGLPPTAGRCENAGPGLRQRQLPVRHPQGLARPGAAGHRLSDRT